MPVEEIEASELVYDPLGAVPDLPFGHLNAAWQRYFDKCSEDDELWSFTAQWPETKTRKVLREGYVLVRDNTPEIYFLTVYKELPVEEPNTQK